ncbi:capsid protein VP2 [Archaeoglobus sp.]
MEDWIHEAIKRPGRVREYLKRKYGNKAFTRDGKIKIEYINKELKRLERGEVTERERSLYYALLLAKRFKVGDLSKSKKSKSKSKNKKNGGGKAKKKSIVDEFEMLWEL